MKSNGKPPELQDDTRAITLHVPEATYREAKALCDVHGQPLSELLGRLLQEWIQRESPSGFSAFVASAIHGRSTSDPAKK